LNTGIGTKASPFLEKEGAPRAIKAGFRPAQLLPERLAAGCQFVTNFNEWLFRHSEPLNEGPDAQLRIGE
jgi:hypothetical protein